MGDEHDDGEVTVTVSTTEDQQGNIINSPVSKMSLIKEIEHLAEIKQRKLGFNPCHILFLSIARTNLPVIRLFMLSPEVIWGYVTSHSNNNVFDLLTFSCRTYHRKQVIFLWIWVSNQKHFSSCLFFSHAIPLLIPCKISKSLQLIIKDGHAEQQNEILRAMKENFPNAIDSGCGWTKVGW